MCIPGVEGCLDPCRKRVCLGGDSRRVDRRIIGTARNKAGVISFTLGDVHPHDLGTIIDHHGVAIRTGHHCAMPAMQFFKVPATARASLGLYNTRQEVDVLVDALEKSRKMFE